MTYCDDCYPKHKDNGREHNIIETDNKTLSTPTGDRDPFFKICSICCQLKKHNGSRLTIDDYLACCGLFFCKRCIPKHERNHSPYLACCTTPDDNKMKRQQCRECKNIVHLKCGSNIKSAPDCANYYYDPDYHGSRFICGRCIFLGGLTVLCKYETPENMSRFCNRELSLFNVPKCRSCNTPLCLEHIIRCVDCQNILCGYCIGRHKCGTCKQCCFVIDNIRCIFCNSPSHCKKLYFYDSDIYEFIQKNICCHCEKGMKRLLKYARCDECQIDIACELSSYSENCETCGKMVHVSNELLLDNPCAMCRDNLPAVDPKVCLGEKAVICCDCKNVVANEVAKLKLILVIPDVIIVLIAQYVCQPASMTRFKPCGKCKVICCVKHLKGVKNPKCINCIVDEEIDYDGILNEIFI
ncbi:MAG: hypothetical protein Hyperionvirus1_4 [Hyperionvirus sp.]|uniref:Uncharacterized protein n=1 Tax=Hyperionvirus sp. TaxID=2487770 RepID=A0A3G5A598_9VIRU|nr:MAG: hypothetical protein Hyperionvirus1_4 [Hyperionvirus sp.]